MISSLVIERIGKRRFIQKVSETLLAGMIQDGL